MNTKHFNLRILLPIMVITLISIACSLPFLSSNPNSNSEMNKSENEDLLIQSGEGALGTEQVIDQKNHFSYSATEAEITRILGNAINTRSDLGISNVIVYLRNGLIEIHGDYNRSGILVPITVKIKLFIDDFGKLQYNVISAKIGPLPLPGNIIDQISIYIDQAIEKNLGINRDDLFFDYLEVANGIISISGYYR